MKLNDKQITDLMQFTKQHLVEYYDVQLELVDHLANDIEHIWLENPALSYEEAKKKAFKKFGVFGFQEVIEEKQKTMRKRYWKMFGKIFTSYFKIPKILMTLSLMMAYYLLISNVPFSKTIIGSSYLIILVLGMIKAYQYHFQIKKKKKDTGKSWLFEDTGNVLLHMIMVLQLPMNILQVFSVKLQFDTRLKWALSTIYIVVFAISVYIIAVRIPREVQKIIHKKHLSYQ